MNSEKIKALREICVRDYKPGNPALSLLIALADFFLADSILQNQDEWLKLDEFCNKYPICHSSEITRMKRYSENFETCYHMKQGTIYCNPKKVFDFVNRNKFKIPRIFKKLKENNFFGFEINESER